MYFTFSKTICKEHLHISWRLFGVILLGRRGLLTKTKVSLKQVIAHFNGTTGLIFSNRGSVCIMDVPPVWLSYHGG
jgi:hypothetical protein